MDIILLLCGTNWLNETKEKPQALPFNPEQVCLLYVGEIVLPFGCQSSKDVSYPAQCFE